MAPADRHETMQLRSRVRMKGRTVQSERKPSKTTDVMVGMLAFSMAENAALLATAGLAPASMQCAPLTRQAPPEALLQHARRPPLII